MKKIDISEEFMTADSDDVLAMHQLAMLNAGNGDHHKALVLYKRITELRPDNIDALLLLGIEYAETGNLNDALSCFLKGVELSPETAIFHKLAGIALSDLGRHHEAREALQNSVEKLPEDDHLLTRLAIEEIYFLQMGLAEQRLTKALEINNSNALAWNNLGRALKFQGRVEEAVSAFRKALEIEPDNFVVADNLLLALIYLQDAEPATVAAEHIYLGSMLYRSENYYSHTSHRHNQKIRIGYVSGDFHNHSVSFFIEPVLQCHNTDRFDIYCYSNGKVEDETTGRLQNYRLTWRDISSLSDIDAAGLIYNDKIDILIDLSGHSSGNRLAVFALKPAPVQASWIGYPHSTGVEAIDYFITDSFCAPQEMTEHLFSEKLIRLPEVFSCYLPPMEFPQVSPPPVISSRTVTFGSFNNFAKVNEKTISLWSRILNRVSDSRIFLKSMALGDENTQERVWAEFAKHSVAKERVALLNTVNSPLEHLALYGKIDIALDTFPYNGTTTTCEALWMGVPVITLTGNTHASRVGGSLMSALDHGELIADSEEKYIDIAAELAQNRKKLIYYRENLRHRMAVSSIMNCVKFTKHLETAFLSLYEKHMGKNH